MPYYIDYYYFILIVPVLFISLICQARVNSAYSKFSRLNNMNGLTGADAARRVLDFYGIQNVRIEHIRGKLNDHYDPRDNVIRLSDGVYGSCSVAAAVRRAAPEPHRSPRRHRRGLPRGRSCGAARRKLYSDKGSQCTSYAVPNRLACRNSARCNRHIFRLAVACEYRDFLLCLCNAVPACNASR